MANVIPAFLPAFVAAAMLARQRRIVRRYEAAGATDPARARTPAELEVEDGRMFERLVDAGVLVAASEGRYFVSGEGLDRARRKRQKRVAIALAVVLVTTLAVVALALRS